MFFREGSRTWCTDLGGRRGRGVTVVVVVVVVVMVERLNFDARIGG
jgi:hypothetical protein